MSTPLPTFVTDTSRAIAQSAKSPGWLHEPLLHFLVLGALLFALDYWIAGRVDNPHLILVDVAVDQQARQTFEAARGRKPNEAELYALRRVWLDNELLYREGLALAVDKGDTAIRERVIFKMLSVVDAGLKLPAVDDKMLSAWFEKQRAKYDEPARYDFEEAVLSGERSEAAVRAFGAALNAGTPGDTKAGLRVFKGRPHENLVQSYGAEFAKGLEALPPGGEWHVLSTREGWRLMRLQAVTPPRPATYETLRGVVLQDWTDTTMAEQRTAAVRALGKKYTVKAEAAAK